MVLKDFMAISGEPGLFRFLAKGKNAIVVEHLETKKRSSAFNSAKVSTLEEISIYTTGEEIPLSKVFDIIHEKAQGGPAIDYRSDPEKLKTWFAEILPEYNRDKVYVSDIKKLVHWYNILHSLNMLVKEEPEKKEEAASEEKPEKKEEVESKEKPEEIKKASTKKKSASKKSSSEEKKPPSRKKSSKSKTD